MAHMPVSVIIPTYNRRHLVCDAIDSVLAQSRSAAEIIVVDDGGKDGTGDTLRSYGGKIRYVFQENAGLSAARNHGIRLATQPFVAFLDDDDVWHPRKLEWQMPVLERDPGLGMIGAEQFDWPIAAFPEIPAVSTKSLIPVSWERLVIKTLVPVSSAIIRRSVLDQVGNFDMSGLLFGSEDRDMFLRVAEVARVAMFDVPLIGYRDTVGSMCKKPAAREQAMREILRRLDEGKVWGGRWLLRRKAYSFLVINCSDAEARAGNHTGSILRILESLAWYPLPYRRAETRMLLERPRRLAVNVLRLLKLKRPDALAAKTAPAANALHALRHRMTNIALSH